MRGIESAFWGVMWQDPELKTSASGKRYCAFSCAVTVGKRDDGKDVTQWVRVGCFGEAAKKLAARAKKGDRVYVEGALTMTRWNDAHGEVKHGLNVAAWRCERVGNIGKHRERYGHGEESPPATLPGLDDGRPSASYCAGSSAPRPFSNVDDFEERGDPLPF